MMTITYEYGDGLYVNLTNKCDCACVFCLRQHKEHKGSIYDDNLWLEREPTREEALEDLLSRDLSSYAEIVFCGFGEPTFRIDDIFWICDQLRATVAQLPPIRINTNGHGSLINHKDIVPGLKGRIDVASVSLNGSNAQEYCDVTRPRAGEEAWQAMLDFVQQASKEIQVVLTVVDKDKTPQELEADRALAQRLGADFRVRAFVPD